METPTKTTGEPKVGTPLDITLLGSGNTLIWCPAGTVQRGKKFATLSKGFWIAKTEVTQEQWESVMGPLQTRFPGENLPVGNISWDKIRKFIAKINESGQLPTDLKMILPTEVQWVHAARAGDTSTWKQYMAMVDEIA